MGQPFLPSEDPGVVDHRAEALLWSSQHERTLLQLVEPVGGSPAPLQCTWCDCPTDLGRDPHRGGDGSIFYSNYQCPPDLGCAAAATHVVLKVMRGQLISGDLVCSRHARPAAKYNSDVARDLGIGAFYPDPVLWIYGE